MIDCEWVWDRVQMEIREFARKAYAAPSEALKRARMKRCKRLNPDVESSKSCPCGKRCMIYNDGSIRDE